MLSPAHLDAHPRVVLPRQPGVQYMVEHWRGWLLFLTNGASAHGEHGVMLCPAPRADDLASAEPQPPWCASVDEWVPLVDPTAHGVVLEQVDVMQDTCALL